MFRPLFVRGLLSIFLFGFDGRLYFGHMKQVIKRRSLLLAAGVCAVILVFPHIVPLPFYTYAVICYGAIHYFLLRQKLSLSDFGLAPGNYAFKPVAIGMFSGFAWLIFMTVFYIPLVSSLFKDAPAYTEYNFLVGNFPALVRTVIAAWLVGGFYEEIAFRGFILLTVESALSRTGKWHAAFAGGLVAVFFGLYHIQQGIFGVIPATLGGCYWWWLYYRTGRNLWVSIFSHATYDTLALILIYLHRFPGQ